MSVVAPSDIYSLRDMGLLLALVEWHGSPSNLPVGDVILAKLAK